VTPADRLAGRAADPFCARGVLAAIHELADATHSNALANLITAGKFRPELLITLGKVGLPRYANFIGRFKDDADADVRRAVATALGLIDNAAVALPVLVHLLAARTAPGDFVVRWEASESLVTIARRKDGEPARRRLAELLSERDAMSVTLGARALAAAGDPRGLAKLRDLTAHADVRVREEATLALGALADTGARDVLARRLQDDSLAVRATAVYALGRTGDASSAPVLRAAVQQALAYETEIERRKERGEPEATLRAQYGLGEYDLRETLQQALDDAARRR